MEIKSPEEFMQAVNASIAFMNKAQRKAFLRWVHTRVRDYNFNYPNGMPQEKETQDADISIVPSTSVHESFDTNNAVDATIVPEGRETGIRTDSTDTSV